MTHPITNIMAADGLIPAETLEPVAATTTPTVGERLIKSATQARDMAASGDLPGTMQGGSANPTTPDLIEREAAAAVDRAIARLRKFDESAPRPAWDRVVAEEMRAAMRAAIRALPAAQPDMGNPITPAAQPAQDVAEVEALRAETLDPVSTQAEIERLTNLIEALRVASRSDNAKSASYRKRAAIAEVDRDTLRKQLAEISQCYTRACRSIDTIATERDALKAEVERLVKVLHRISAPQYGLQSLVEDNASESEFTNYWRNMASRFATISLAALRAHEQGEG